MSATTLVLANNPREGGNYARRVGLGRNAYRVIHSPRQVKGLPWSGAQIHILPSFQDNLARHAILAALRWKRVDYFYVDPEDFPFWSREQELQRLKLGELTDRQYDVAVRYNRLWSDGARRREVLGQLDGLSTDEIAERLQSDPGSADAPVLVEAIKTKAKAEGTPRRKTHTQGTPAPRPAATTAESFFGS